MPYLPLRMHTISSSLLQELRNSVVFLVSYGVPSSSFNFNLYAIQTEWLVSLVGVVLNLSLRGDSCVTEMCQGKGHKQVASIQIKKIY